MHILTLLLVLLLFCGCQSRVVEPDEYIHIEGYNILPCGLLTTRNLASIINAGLVNVETQLLSEKKVTVTNSNLFLHDAIVFNSTIKKYFDSMIEVNGTNKYLCEYFCTNCVDGRSGLLVLEGDKILKKEPWPLLTHRLEPMIQTDKLGDGPIKLFFSLRSRGWQNYKTLARLDTGIASEVCNYNQSVLTMISNKYGGFLNKSAVHSLQKTTEFNNEYIAYLKIMTKLASTNGCACEFKWDDGKHYEGGCLVLNNGRIVFRDCWYKSN